MLFYVGENRTGQCGVLDTDDGVLEWLDENVLYEYIDSKLLCVDNVIIIGDDLIVREIAGEYFFTYNKVEMLGGRVRYTCKDIEPKQISYFFTTKENLRIGDVNHIIKYHSSPYNPCVLNIDDFEIDVYDALATKSGIHYMMLYKNHLIVRYVVVGAMGHETISLVFTLDGKLIGILPNKVIKCRFDPLPPNSFVSKLSMMET